MRQATELLGGGVMRDQECFNAQDFELKIPDTVAYSGFHKRDQIFSGH